MSTEDTMTSQPVDPVPRTNTDPTEILDELTVLAAGRIQRSGPASWSARVAIEARDEIKSLRVELAAVTGRAERQAHHIEFMQRFSEARGAHREEALQARDAALAQLAAQTERAEAALATAGQQAAISALREAAQLLPQHFPRAWLWARADSLAGSTDTPGGERTPESVWSELDWHAREQVTIWAPTLAAVLSTDKPPCRCTCTHRIEDHNVGIGIACRYYDCLSWRPVAGSTEPATDPSPETIERLVAASAHIDIHSECIRQAAENVKYLTAMSHSWIINGDEHHGAMLQGLCLAFGFQQTEIERLRVENANLRAVSGNQDDQPGSTT